jgi:hypothetical protein
LFASAMAVETSLERFASQGTIRTDTHFRRGESELLVE